MVDDRRNQILDGVWRVIVEDGLTAVSVRSVAAAAGVSAGRVQHYFPTKSALVRASVERMLDGAAQVNPEASGDASDPATLSALLLHALTPAAESRAGTSVYFSFVAAGVTDPWIARVLADAKQGLVDAVCQCLRAQRPDLSDPQRRAQELVLLADGAVLAVFLGQLSQRQAREIITAAIAS